MKPLFMQGWYSNNHAITPSPFFNERPTQEISLIVIHNISLPLGQFGTPYIEQLFTGCIDCHAHPSFADLQGLQVSSHFLITRNGLLQQFVSTEKRAWHAGVSCYKGRENCNDYSIGIELEGSDFTPFTEQQYHTLQTLCQDLINFYQIPINNIVGHSDIAPGRKTDPGPYFDWPRFTHALQ